MLPLAVVGLLQLRRGARQVIDPSLALDDDLIVAREFAKPLELVAERRVTLEHGAEVFGAPRARAVLHAARPGEAQQLAVPSRPQRKIRAWVLVRSF